MNRSAITLAAMAAFAALIGYGTAAQQQAPLYENPAETREALRLALAERAAAQQRSITLERAAREASSAAEQTASEAAAVAARIQQAEAGIAAAEARIGLIGREAERLREMLGREQQPVMQLTAALQQFTRRPVALSVLREGEVKDIVYLRAVLSNTVPQVQARTASLRGQLDRSRQLEREAQQARAVLRQEETQLAARRGELADMETRQRLAARQAGGTANREAERALALAEQARDLDALVSQLDRAAGLRATLAALPGPRLRPEQPGLASTAPADMAQPQAAAAGDADSGGAAIRPAPAPYILPVTGRTVIGFGAPLPAGGLSQGLSLAPRAGAQIVAPAPGRVAFSGIYRGYGQIVILEHDGGWTSLITGLARSDVQVGEQLVGGAPLGIAGPGRPLVTLELRSEGEPVNPLQFVS